MNKLKYGKVYIEKSTIINALGLPHESVHLKSVCVKDGTVEFKVIADSSVEHEYLTEMSENGSLDNIRRYRANFSSESFGESE